MLFNSYEFIIIFLPATLTVYFLLNKKKLTIASKVWLSLASLFFYGWWDINYLPLILGSIIFNYSISTTICKIEVSQQRAAGRKSLLIFGIVSNLALLGYFKYMDFFITSINHLTLSQIRLYKIILPLGISFFTFTQIAHLVDAYKGKILKHDFMNYLLFVTFFPHLLAGPIIHNKEMMPQFDKIRNKVINHTNLSIGLSLFAIGLFKKTVLADTFALYANNGFDSAKVLSLLEAWITSISYSFQIYFDFSGYTDMALGSALMFNIKLPVNFNSPYKALNIREFWQRWHMTLSRFLMDYLYIPLGGNRAGNFNTYRNLMLTFLLGGLWHGAGITFLFWGFLHGTAIIIHRVWEQSGIKLHRRISLFLTFMFLNISWVFFRAKDFNSARKVLTAMIDIKSLSLEQVSRLTLINSNWIESIGKQTHLKTGMMFITILAGFIIIFYMKNSNELSKYIVASPRWSVISGILLATSLMLLSRKSEFLYFIF